MADDMVRLVDAALLDIARLHPGDPVVIVAGSPPGIPGPINALRVHRIGHGRRRGGSGVPRLTERPKRGR